MVTIIRLINQKKLNKKVSNLNLSKANNVFDVLNQYTVYNDSGSANYTRWQKIAEMQNTGEYVNSISDWFKNETFYSNPRRIEIGLTYVF